MAGKLINIKSYNVCAFCRYWYDPTNSAITPEAPQAGFWRFDMNRRELCMKKAGIKMRSWCSCSQYKCKIEV